MALESVPETFNLEVAVGQIQSFVDRFCLPLVQIAEQLQQASLLPQLAREAEIKRQGHEAAATLAADALERLSVELDAVNATLVAARAVHDTDMRLISDREQDLRTNLAAERDSLIGQRDAALIALQRDVETERAALAAELAELRLARDGMLAEVERLRQRFAVPA